MEPVEVELAAFSRILSGGQKVFYIKKEENSLSDLSHDARKSFSGNESYQFFSYIKDLKPFAVTHAFLHQILTSKIPKVDKCF